VLAAGESYNDVVTCPAGTAVTGGGARADVTGGGDADLMQSHPFGSTGWVTQVRNNGPTAVPVTWYAVCIPYAA